MTMIEIIGTDEAKKRKITCKECCSILSYTNFDTVVEVRTDYTGGKDRYRVLCCPKCNNKMTVECL